VFDEESMQFSVPSSLVGGVLFALMFSTNPAQAEESIATDRPDFVESSDTVGKGRFQIETSLAWERDKSGGISARMRATPTLLRYGVSEDWELRLETDGWLKAKVSGPGFTLRESGRADIALGAKYHWKDGDEATGAPGMAWLFHVDLKTGSQAFRAASVRTSVRMVAEWEFAGGWTAGVMPGLYTERNDSGKRFVGGILAGVVGKSLTENLRGFVEVSAQQIASNKNGGNVLTFDTGLAYLLNNSTQVDFAISRGLNKTTPDLAWTIGLSAKF
jgi:hypothetical protein